MASSKLAARAIRNHAKYKGRNDLNIVPMIDMMVILVFFLLFTAVFSNTNILELNLPAPNSSVPDLPKGLQLEIHVRHTTLDVADRNSGILRSLPMKDGEYDYKALSEYLQFVKSKYQGVTEASVLLEQDISYDVLVQTMDNVRLFQMDDPPLFTKVELFPDISVGDAPLTGAAAAQAPTAGNTAPAKPAGARK